MPEIEGVTALRARELTDRIRVAVDTTWVLIEEAYTSRAWAALGYDSWDEYCAKEFGATRLKLPREERQEVVVSLREAGLSSRAIGAATGQSHTQVQRDIRATGTNVPPEHQRVTADSGESRPPVGVDGKVYPSPRNALGMDEYWTPDDAPGLPERQDDADAVVAEIDRRAAAKARAPRTDVVGTVSALLAKADDAASLADRITTDHMSQRSEEAAVWGRRLETALAPLHRLLDTFKENQ